MNNLQKNSAKRPIGPRSRDRVGPVRAKACSEPANQGPGFEAGICAVFAAVQLFIATWLPISEYKCASTERERERERAATGFNHMHTFCQAMITMIMMMVITIMPTGKRIK